MRGENAEVIVFLLIQISVVVTKSYFMLSARLNPCNCHLLGGELLAFVKARIHFLNLAFASAYKFSERNEFERNESNNIL